MSKKVSFAHLHSGVFLGQNIGDLGQTLPPVNKSFTKFEMSYTADGLLLEIVPRRESFTVKALIPQANIKVMTLAQEEPTKPTEAVKLNVKKDSTAAVSAA